MSGRPEVMPQMTVMLGNLQVALQAGEQGLRSSASALIALTEQARSRVSSLQAQTADTPYADIGSALDAGVTEAEQAFGDLDTLLDSHATFCDQWSASASLGISEANELLEQMAGELTEQTDILEQAANGARGFVEQAEQQCEDAWQTTGTVVDESAEGVQQQADAVVEEFTQTIKSVSEFSDDLSEDVRSAVTKELEDFRAACDADVAGHVASGQREIEERFAQVVTNFSLQVGQVADRFTQSGETLVQDFSRHVTDEVTREIESAFREVLERVLAALAEQIAEMLTQMSLGQAATSALSPILPQLLAAYKALKLVNDLLDSLGM